MRRSKLSILGLAVLGIAVVSGVVAAAGPPVINRLTRKFDHDRHAASSSAAGKKAECATCHQLDANGAPKPGREHTRCASCHTYTTSCTVMKTPGVKGPARVCQVCHTPTRRACLPRDLPTPSSGRSYESRFTHSKHLSLGKSIEKDCAQCHKQQANPTTTQQPAHQLCSGCHNPNGAKPSMNECASCHGAPQPRTPPSNDPFRLAGFDHRNHHAKSSNQATCLTCHDKLRGAADNALPRPSMLGCQTTCHDGQKAFSAVGTKCTQCHKGSTAAQPTRSDVPFSHSQHAARNVKIADCNSCHVLETDGTLATPLKGKDHTPCSTQSCHQNEFASRTVKICGTCHDSIAPWQKAVARYSPPVEGHPPEYFETINHQSHIAKLVDARMSEAKACQQCHGDKLTGGKPPAAHQACAECHGRGQGPAMTQCASCHLAQPPSRATTSEWSVRATFPHPKHASDPRARGKTTSCAECHSGVKSAKDMAAIKPPKMSQCDSCHNGKLAFKTTGFECSRCHTQAGKSQPSAMQLPVTVPRTAMAEVRP